MLLCIRVSLLLVVVDELLGMFKGYFKAHMLICRDLATEISFLAFLCILRLPVLVSLLFLYLFVLL